MPKLTIEEIAEIKNALTIIQLSAQTLPISFLRAEKARKEIIEQVKRIDRLLPKIKYEKEKKL